jgi:polyhydroxybutyrate depolymerase
MSRLKARVHIAAVTTIALCSVALTGCSGSDAPTEDAASAGASATTAGQGGGDASSQAGSSGASGAPVAIAGSSSGGGANGGSSTDGGSTGNGGSSTDGGSGTAGGGGGAPAAASPGCNLPAAQALASWVEQPKLPVNGKDRQWWIWLPTDYNPTRAYPVVFTFHGCGSPDNYVPMQKVTADKAIVVRGTGISNNCWGYSANGDDVKFFDAMLAALETKRCVDQSRIFTTGYSSGSWLVNTLNCERGDKLRASGSVSGGVAVNTAMCPGSATPAVPPKAKEYARIFIHDADDTTNKFMGNGNDKELARLVAANHCMPTGPVPEDPSPCARYQGCDAGMPVIMCRTTGKRHDRQDTLATTAFWKLFSSL